LRTLRERATPCVVGASSGSAFSAEEGPDVDVLFDLGRPAVDVLSKLSAFSDRGGGGGRLLAPRGVGIMLFCGVRFTS